jgi:hypothetical protein
MLYLYFESVYHKLAALSELDFPKEWQIYIHLLEVLKYLVLTLLPLTFTIVVSLVIMWNKKNMDS